MKNTEIHLSDFPEDKIVVFIEDEFRNNLISQAIGLSNGRKHMAQFLGIKKLDTIGRWKDGRINRGQGWITEQGIPLKALKKISDFLVSRKESIFNMEEIEKHVIAYKSKGKSLLIKNPHLPIKESPELFRIMAHMMGDGSANTSSVNYFKNTDKNVINEFIDDMHTVFGDVETSSNKDVVVFPITVRHILSGYYGIQFGTFTASLPFRLFELSPAHASGFVRAFMDDEGNVQTSCIRLYSFNKNLIYGIRKLIAEKLPEIKGMNNVKRRLRKHGKYEYVLEIRSEGIKEFYEIVGCSHSRKNERLKFYIKRSEKSWNHRKRDETKKMILKSLSESSKTTDQLCNELMVSRVTVLSHIKGYSQKRKQNSKSMLERKLIMIGGYDKYNSVIWQLTHNGAEYLNSTKKDYL
jgi:hypothetical protein